MGDKAFDRFQVGINFGAGFTYDKLNARLCVPCSRKEFYELYRRFFYILDKERR
jgi:hypothetical protein